MAIYHLSIKPVQRSQGKSATAAAAYRSGAQIDDAQTGERHDYRKRHGVEASQIITPDGSESDRATLWNMAEEAEKRKDGTPAKEYEIALPSELDPEQRRELVLEFGKLIVERHGVAVDIAIHAPTEKGDQRNHHAHILATTHKLENGKLTGKSDFDLSDRDRKKKNLPGRKQELLLLREEWERLVNQALARAGKREKISHKKLEAQGIERPPTVHLGPAATAMEQKGIRTERGDLNRKALAAPSRKIFSELEQLREQETGISEAKARYAGEKARRVAKEARIKNYELEILGEGAGGGETGSSQRHTQSVDQDKLERDSSLKSAGVEGRGGKSGQILGSDGAAGASGKFEALSEAAGQRVGAVSSGNEPDQARHQAARLSSWEAGGWPGKAGTDSEEFSERVGRGVEQGATGSVSGSRDHIGADRPDIGENRGTGEKNQFASTVKELEERILWLIREYRNFIDLLAMGRKGRKHGESKRLEGKEKPATRQPRM